MASLRQIRRIVAYGTLILGASAAAPAVADTPLEPITLGAGVQIAPDDTLGKVSALADLTASYDFGPRTVVPVRLALEANVLTGSFQSAYGGNVTVRLTTPFYAGVGLGVYAVNVETAYATPASNAASSGGLAAVPAATTYATEFFAGQRLFSVPGATVSLQATYRMFPISTFPGAGGSYRFPTFPSTAGVGLRVKL